MGIDSTSFRTALGCFATGVTVITSLEADGTPVGVTVNSFASVSLEPPLVLFSLGREAFSFDAFIAAPAFAVNVLAEDQEALSRRFSRRALQERWQGVDVERWETGVPILSGCLASLECDKHASFDGGDHVILVGRVRKLTWRAEGRPLLYLRGGYAKLA